MDLDIFNYAPMDAFSHLSHILQEPRPLSALDDPDLFYSWTVIASERHVGGSRLLLQYPDGGLAWLYVDATDMITRSSMVADAEARELWPRLILQTSSKLRDQVDEHMTAGLALNTALAGTFGPHIADGLLDLGHVSAEDGAEARRLLMPRGGVLEVWLTNTGDVTKTNIIDGDDAWAIVQPVIDSDDDDI